MSKDGKTELYEKQKSRKTVFINFGLHFIGLLETRRFMSWEISVLSPFEHSIFRLVLFIRWRWTPNEANIGFFITTNIAIFWKLTINKYFKTISDLTVFIELLKDPSGSNAALKGVTCFSMGNLRTSTDWNDSCNVEKYWFWLRGGELRVI